MDAGARRDQLARGSGRRHHLGLDTLVEGTTHGSLSDATMEWLEDTQRDLRHRPVLIFMHHPPVRTGVSAMDAILLARNSRFKAALRKHDGQVQIAFGHVHRMMIGQVATLAGC